MLRSFRMALNFCLVQIPFLYTSLVSLVEAIQYSMAEYGGFFCLMLVNLDLLSLLNRPGSYVTNSGR